MPHTDDRVCLTVQLWIVHKDAVLLRYHEKYHAWLGVGGHIDPGEDPLEAAHREAMEEVGLVVTIPGELPYSHGNAFTELPVPAFVNRHKVTDSHDHFCLEYFAVSDSDVIVQPDTHEKTVCKWCTREDIHAMAQEDILPSVRRYALAALEALGSKPL